MEQQKEIHGAPRSESPYTKEQIAAFPGVVEVLQLLAYCNRIQAGFPQTSNLGKSWITNTSQTV